MINFNPNIGQATTGTLQQVSKPQGETGQTGEFSKTVNAVEKYLSNVDQDQQSSNMSIQDLLAGRNDDIASVVAAVAKADISFKVLVGVRNKLIDAYKQTMNMQM
ncbi:MAG: flagellar hook-basal body complex protein FliE [Sedimentisphaerales bacterium]|jgi:flagellar hook-basal body complex protein FliE